MKKYSTIYKNGFRIKHWIIYLQQMKRERGEECETKKNNWLDTGFYAITSCDCWRTLFSNRYKHYVDADIDGAWFIEHQCCGNVPYIK